jgi:hypothetical protein
MEVCTVLDTWYSVQYSTTTDTDGNHYKIYPEIRVRIITSKDIACAYNITVADDSEVKTFEGLAHSINTHSLQGINNQHVLISTQLPSLHCGSRQRGPGASPNPGRNAIPLFNSEVWQLCSLLHQFCVGICPWTH